MCGFEGLLENDFTFLLSFLQLGDFFFDGIEGLYEKDSEKVLARKKQSQYLAFRHRCCLPPANVCTRTACPHTLERPNIVSVRT